MQNKNNSSLTISVGIGIRTLPKSTNEIINDDEKFDFKELKRKWVLRAHINLLRAKEHHKNCCFYELVC